MSKITVCGLVNLETTVPVGRFPIEYSPVDYKFFSVNTQPSGVGLNLALALTKLGSKVDLLSLCGDDIAGKVIKDYLKASNISSEYVQSLSKSTPQSVVLYDNEGKRKVYCDLTDMQENAYPSEFFENASKGSDICVLCNINFARHLIPLAKERGKLIATDVHCLSDIYDEYNGDFISAADILFLSNENFVSREEEFVNSLKTVTNAKIIVVGMGSRGALLYLREKDKYSVFPAVYTRPVVNTVGAGDSLFASFLHFYSKTEDAEYSLKLATIFASYKIGETSASKGFLSEKELLNLYKDC
ncbi:MAG: carbohydrate kinase family protein [Clostridia bacterium]|nr:carbohydrate kinase family protein [Clostridia bacterium]